MSLAKVQLLILFFDDMKSIHVEILENEPIKVDISQIDDSFFANMQSVRIVMADDSERRVHDTKVVEITKDYITLEVGEHVEEHILFDYHTVEYKQEVSVALLKQEDIEKYAQCAERINTRERHNLALRIKSAINREDIDNPEILSFLVDINSKLDEILSYMRPKEEIEGLFAVKCIQLSGAGFIFYSNRDLRGIDNIFMTATVNVDSSRLSFASLCQYQPLKINFDGTGIYIAKFENMLEDVRDNVIKITFSLERDMLKNARKRSDIS